MSAPTARSTRREPVAGHVRSEDFRHRAACRGVDPEHVDRPCHEDRGVSPPDRACWSVAVRAWLMISIGLWLGWC
ncbi:hypothetical protein, partial [Pseudonocardia nigra]|uniref:hypothetical protein n=1 Tax=Pseudonocardia nigra TaxID=1921578 RepID=UPI001C5DCBAA